MYPGTLSPSSGKGIDFNHLVHTSGFGGTQAGLIMGAKAFSTNIRVIDSTSGSRLRGEQIENVFRLIQESEKLFGADLKITQEDVVV